MALPRDTVTWPCHGAGRGDAGATRSLQPLCQQECTDPCCNSSACQLMPGAECATGDACCQDCQVCRDRQLAGLALQPLPRVGFLRVRAHLTVRPHSCAVPDTCAGRPWASATCPSSVTGSHHAAHPTPSCRTDSPAPVGGRSATVAHVPPMRGSASSCWGQVRRGWGGGEELGGGAEVCCSPAAGASPVSSSCMASLNVKADERGHCGQLPNGSYIACTQR